MKLPAALKQMLDALALANAAEYLSGHEKSRVLSSVSVPPPKYVAAPKAAQPQVGLYLGSEPSADVMQYAVQTCERLQHGLTVFTFQSENEARALLEPYRGALESAGIESHLVALTGEPIAPLAQALRRHSGIAFLVCNESGYLGNSLVSGRVRRDSIPVPVVLVGSNDQAMPATPQTTGATHVA